MAELKEMLQTLMKQNLEERQEAKVARCEACQKGQQVQHWATACRSLDSQVKELQKAVEALSQASFCSGSTLLSASLLSAEGQSNTDGSGAESNIGRN
jgi:hypothetical protein